ncbi:MAG: hypothetical protein AAF721_27070 [Myxococcota bacterium]
MKLSSRLSSLALLGLAVATVGCAKDPGNGGVTINYEWLLGAGCDNPFNSGDQVVNEVRVTLTNGGDERTETEACDGESITIDGVQEGSYTVLVEGLDVDGDAIADNLAMPATDESVSVSEGSTSSVDAELGPAPATIEVALVVENDQGFAVMCNDSGIKFFNVRAIGQSVGELHSQELDFCTHGVGFQPVPDDMRQVNGLLLNRIDVAWENPMGTELGEQQFPLGEPLGAGKTVQVRMDCVETDCMGTLTLPGGGMVDDGDPTGGGESGMPGTTGGGGTTGGADSTGGGGSTGGADTTGG